MSVETVCMRKRHRAEQRIGICVEHGWWFGLDDQNVVACLEPGCRADVQLYDAGERVPYLTSLATKRPEA